MSKYDKYMDIIQSRGLLRHTVTQDNALVRAKYSYNYRELKLSRLISSKINPFNPDQGYKIRLKKDEVEAYFIHRKSTSKKYGSIYNDFDNLMNGLNSKPIHILIPKAKKDNETATPKKKIVAYWVSDYSYDYQTQTYEINIPEKIRPFLIALKNSTNTSIPLYIYDVIHKVHLCRLYEILYSFRNMRGGRVRYRRWEELRDQIGLSCEWKYFNSRILKPAKILFPEVASMTFDYKTTKRAGSKAIEGLEITVKIVKKVVAPSKSNLPSLFPTASNEEVQLVEDIKHTLLGWGIDMLKIEELIDNPYSFIESDHLLEKVSKDYNRLQYIWDKMEYVNNTRQIKKSKAALFFAAIKNNYEKAAKVKVTNDSKLKDFREERENDIAEIENQRTSINREYHMVVVSIIENMLSENELYRKHVFDMARQKHADSYNEPLTDEQLFNHSNPIFRKTVISATKRDFPDAFSNIDIMFDKKRDILNQKQNEVEMRKFS